MVLIIPSRKVRNHLTSENIIYFVSDKKRNEDEDWITDKFGGKKIADANIELERKIDLSTHKNLEAILYMWLKTYVEHSGFENTYQWIGDIKKSNDGETPEELYLYEIILSNNASST
ncbi:hypothetical protein AKJ48_01130 [candidate division MSBL1 archaeon SCGC-AAA261O19]|uniref:Uncharacterized protein n=1 Tax=candidate division MSBL1 archaeon SCGC-AAA261O19 TaxID=1698277 RepID=A0A133VEK6_9EURY|nr:hypothetical protein AKJ48_01130 [candidate division MSBL1 archaeon SCGC-AAA261O19]